MQKTASPIIHTGARAPIAHMVYLGRSSISNQLIKNTYVVGEIASRYAEEKREQRATVRRAIWAATFTLVILTLYFELGVYLASGFCGFY